MNRRSIGASSLSGLPSRPSSRSVVAWNWRAACKANWKQQDTAETFRVLRAACRILNNLKDIPIIPQPTGSHICALQAVRISPLYIPHLYQTGHSTTTSSSLVLRHPSTLRFSQMVGTGSLVERHKAQRLCSAPEIIFSLLIIWTAATETWLCGFA